MQRVFLNYSTCAVNFINKIWRSSWTWHDLWKLLTINFRNIYFHNFVDWSGLYLQVYIPTWLAKTLTLTVFRLLENSFVKLSCLYHDLIINPPCRTVPQKIFSKQFAANLPLKGSLHTLWARHYVLVPLEMHVGVYPSIFARTCRIKLANILSFAKRIVRQSVSLRII